MPVSKYLVSSIAIDCIHADVHQTLSSKIFQFSQYIKHATSTAWDAEEVHVKWCLTWYWDFGAEMVFVESIKTQVLHLATWQGKAPFCDDESHLICLVFCHVIDFTF